jgi:hypothetical protein
MSPIFRKTYVAETEADTLAQAIDQFDDDGAEYGPSVVNISDTQPELVHDSPRATNGGQVAHDHTWTCPNCMRSHGIVDACFLGMLLAVANDRNELSVEELERVMDRVDVDYLWERFGGPATDYIEHLAEQER